MNELPKKLDDPGKFAVPCSIGNVRFKQALCDLGASVSLMPKTIFDKIGVGELRPTKISLQLADQTVKLPIGIVEDMPIQIGKYFVPIDFVIVDMKEDTQTPLLLGRPFLNTARAIIDVHEGKISFKIGEEKITFHVDRALKYPTNEDPIFKVDAIDVIVEEQLQKTLTKDPLDEILGNSNATQKEQQERISPSLSPQGRHFEPLASTKVDVKAISSQGNHESTPMVGMKVATPPPRNESLNKPMREELEDNATQVLEECTRIEENEGDETRQNELNSNFYGAQKSDWKKIKNYSLNPLSSPTISINNMHDLAETFNNALNQVHKAKDLSQDDSNFYKVDKLTIKLEAIKKAFETIVEMTIKDHMLDQGAEESWNVRRSSYKDDEIMPGVHPNPH